MLADRMHGEIIDAPTDEEIAFRSIDDLQHFGLLYDRYAERVFRYCAVRLGDVHAAQDATSLVFTKALAARSSFNGGRFSAWLFRIAHNVVVDEQRRARPRISLDAIEALADPGESPESRAIRNDDAQNLRRRLSQLSVDQQRVIELRLAGLNGNEISETLGLRRNTVDALAHRAIVRLRELMAQDGPIGGQP